MARKASELSMIGSEPFLNCLWEPHMNKRQHVGMACMVLSESLAIRANMHAHTVHKSCLHSVTFLATRYFYTCVG